MKTKMLKEQRLLLTLLQNDVKDLLLVPILKKDTVEDKVEDKIKDNVVDDVKGEKEDDVVGDVKENN